MIWRRSMPCWRWTPAVCSKSSRAREIWSRGCWRRYVLYFHTRTSLISVVCFGAWCTNLRCFDVFSVCFPCYIYTSVANQMPERESVFFSVRKVTSRRKVEPLLSCQEIICKNWQSCKVTLSRWWCNSCYCLHSKRSCSSRWMPRRPTSSVWPRGCRTLWTRLTCWRLRGLTWNTSWRTSRCCYVHLHTHTHNPANVYPQKNTTHTHTLRGYEFTVTARTGSKSFCRLQPCFLPLCSDPLF